MPSDYLSSVAVLAEALLADAHISPGKLWGAALRQQLPAFQPLLIPLLNVDRAYQQRD